MKKRTEEVFAVKVVVRKNLPLQDEEALRSEVDILRTINSPYVIKCVDFFEEEAFFFVVLEYLAGGELFDRIVKKTSYSEAEARDLVRTLLLAIKSVHDKNVVHRDLKPENLLLKSPTDDQDVKLADFGFAVVVQNDNCLTTQCGTPGYVAPEILKGAMYGRPADMWSMGVITYIILGGYPPFYDDNQKMLFSKIKKGMYEFHEDYWSGVSGEAKNLIRSMLCVVPENRITVDTALQHNWIKRDSTELASRNLNDNLKELKKFNARRRLRAAIKAVSSLMYCYIFRLLFATQIVAIQRIHMMTRSIKVGAMEFRAAENASASEVRMAETSTSVTT